MSKPPVPFAPETLETIQRAFRLATDRRHVRGHAPRVLQLTLHHRRLTAGDRTEPEPLDVEGEVLDEAKTAPAGGKYGAP